MRYFCFRLSKPLEPERAKFPKFGSKYRYPGRTQHQVAGAPDTDRPAPIIRRGAGTRFMARGPTDTVDTTGKVLSSLLSTFHCCVYVADDVINPLKGRGVNCLHLAI